MLDALLKFGSHRIDYFDRSGKNPQAFAFYIRGGLDQHQGYSGEAKHQLYRGLALIGSRLGLANLAAVYIDVNDLCNLQRPAYVQLKRDMLGGMFTRVFILERAVLFGDINAENDFVDLISENPGFELLCCDGAGNISVPGWRPNVALLSI